MSAKFDELLKKIGDLGKFQKRHFLLLVLIILPASYMTYIPMFILTVPEHRCRQPGIENDTYKYQIQHLHQIKEVNSSFKEMTSSCTVTLPVIGPSANVSMFQPINDSERMSHQTIDCHSWVYDKKEFDFTLIEKFDLVCQKEEIRTHANMAMMCGKLVSAVVQGICSDRYGRKKSLMVFILVLIASAFANTFVFNIPSLVVFRFAAGFSSTSIYLAAYVLGLELMGTSHRRLFSVTLSSMWTVGGFVLTGFAYFIRDYRDLYLSLAAPTTLFLTYFWFICESPRWLLSKGRVKEAEEQLEKIAATNGTIFPRQMFMEIVNTEFHLSGNNQSEDKTTNSDLDKSQTVNKQKGDNFIFLLRNRRLRIYFFIIVLNWVVNSLVYYALMFNVSNLAGSIYLNFFLLNCVDLASNVLSYFLVDRIGRRLSYDGFLLLATIPCLVAILPPYVAGTDTSNKIISGLSLTGRAGISTSFNILYLFSAELFPTTVRNTLMGSFSMSSRVGSIVAPYIADLGMFVGASTAKWLPLLICGVMGVFALIFAFFLPETAGKVLPNDIEEASRYHKSKNNES